MHSVVGKGRIARWLAFVALALQLVLSFGHVHLDGARHSYPVAANAAAGGAASPLPDPLRSDDGDDYCAVCATIFLASNSFVPQAPVLPAPPAARAVDHGERAIVFLTTERRTPFRSRAPPAA